MGASTDLMELVRAVDDEEVTTVQAILQREPGLARVAVAAEQQHTQTLLHRAIPGDGERLNEAHMAIVTHLLDAGAAVNAPGWGANNGLCTPITMAAWGGHAAMIRLLVSRGAEPNGSAEQQARGHKPIDTAAHHGHTDAVEALIEAGAEYSLEHLVLVAAEARLAQILEADPGAASRPLAGGMPPLNLALTAGKGARLVRLLLAHGADLGARDGLGRTAIHVAIENEDWEAAPLLIERGAPIDLFAAAGLGDADRVAGLLAEDPSRAQAAPADGLTPLFYAAWAGDARSVRLLLDAGTEVSPRVKRLWACLTPLHAALMKRHEEVVAALLERGADVNAFAAVPGSYWPTPLHVAARWGTRDDVQLLLEHGADLNGGEVTPDTMDSGVVSLVVSAGNVGLLELLLEHGLDLRHERHREALHRAAERGHPELVRLLVENGADPCAIDADGQTPLDRAHTAGKTEVAELLQVLASAG
jgi:ankyrin repeat protein